MSLESLYWELGQSSPLLEPDSPSEWFVQDYPCDDADGFNSPADVVPSRADLAQQLLDDLEEYVKKEESFSNWFDEEKTILPPLQIFDDFQVVSETAGLPQSAELTCLTSVTPSYMKVEVNSTFGHGHLTPPQSPPQGPLLTLHPSPVSYVTLETCQNEYPVNYLPDVAREMAVVDEVVRGVAQEWESVEYNDSTSRSSDSTSGSVDESDDPEWQPALVASAKSAGRASRRSRPYNQSDRRQRKKEQNKTAATRYRMKKKAEVCTIVGEERVLTEKNQNLHDKVSDIEKEISYLKNLMREMFRAKGLVN